MAFIHFLKTNAKWLAAGFLLTLTSSYGQTFFISIFAGEIRSEFGLTHGEWGLIYTLGTGMSALAMVWAGGLTDRLRVRMLGPIVFAALAFSCLAMAANHIVWVLPIVIFALRFTGQGVSSHLATVAMARWFSAGRGRALAVASMGFALGQAVFPIAFVYTKSIVDWRLLWVFAALLAAIAIVPLIKLLRQERTPQSISASSETLGMKGKHWRRSVMFAHPLFWFMIPALLGPSAWSTALFFQQVHLTEIRGWSHAEFVSLMPVFTVFAITATFATGWAVDRFGSSWFMAAQGVPMIAAFGVLGSSESFLTAAIALPLLAITIGGNATLPGTFAAEYFGTKHIGGIKSVWAAIMVFGSAIGPGVSGMLIDRGIDFGMQTLAISGYFVVSTFCLVIGIARARRDLPAAA